MTSPCGSGAEVVVCVVVRVAVDVLQIETNRNTALTLACFQGRHEVVGLLCQRGGNVEHRAKVGEGLAGLSLCVWCVCVCVCGVCVWCVCVCGVCVVCVCVVCVWCVCVVCVCGVFVWCVCLCVVCVRVSTCVCHCMLYVCPLQTGLTPLMEAASGGYHEVGRILVEHVSR